MKPIPITMVRFNAAESRRLLEQYFAADAYGPRSVPRGIEPTVVSAFIRERVTSESDPGICSKALELVRFYESRDVLPHFRSILRGEKNPDETDALLRSAYVLQVVGDLGAPAEIQQAIVYLDQLVSTHPAATLAFDILGETVIALVSPGSLQRLAQRLSDRVARAAQAQNQSADHMREYQTVLSIQRNSLPKIEFALEGKRRLLSRSASERRPQLVATYLKRFFFGTIQMEVWAARLLRAEAMHDNPQPVYDEFRRAIDVADQEHSNEQFRAFIIERAAQAILYLQGTLSPEHTVLYETVKRGRPNFLWDYL